MHFTSSTNTEGDGVLIAFDISHAFVDFNIFKCVWKL
jgi:hypothetical protein